MNSNQIYDGEIYAWYPQRPKGTFPVGAAKVRVNRVRKSKYTYQKNARTDVEITIISPGSGGLSSYYVEGRQLTVPARELVDFWDSYHDEESVILKDREKQQYELRKAEVEKAVVENLIQLKLTEKGFPHAAVRASMVYDSVTIPLASVLTWLQIPKEEIDRNIAFAVGAPPEETPEYITGGNGE